MLVGFLLKWQSFLPLLRGVRSMEKQCKNEYYSKAKQQGPAFIRFIHYLKRLINCLKVS